MRPRYQLWIGLLGITAISIAMVVGFRHGQPHFLAEMPAASPAPATGTVLGTSSDINLAVGKLTRQYNVYVPSNYRGTSPIPLVVAYHGEGGTVKTFMEQSGLTSAAEKYGFIVAFPSGWKASAKPADYSANPQTWNDGSGLTPAGKAGIDDVAFTKALITDLNSRYKLDAGRIYATGYANGGSMVLRLAVEQAGLFTAVAVTSANGLNTATKQPSRVVPIMLIQGGADPVRSKTFAGQLMARLVTLYGCKTAVNTRTIVPGVTAATYPMCPAGMSASYVFVRDMGHTWAGGTGNAPELLTGPTTTSVSSTELTWQFLGSQARR